MYVEPPPLGSSFTLSVPRATAAAREGPSLPLPGKRKPGTASFSNDFSEPLSVRPLSSSNFRMPATRLYSRLNQVLKEIVTPIHYPRCVPSCQPSGSANSLPTRTASTRLDRSWLTSQCRPAHSNSRIVASPERGDRARKVISGQIPCDTVPLASINGMVRRLCSPAGDV
jgi:hypothetical protein